MKLNVVALSEDPRDAEKVLAQGMDLVHKVIDPEIDKFEQWFSDPKRGNGRFIGLEREILRSYLYQKLTGVL